VGRTREEGVARGAQERAREALVLRARVVRYEVGVLLRMLGRIYACATAVAAERDRRGG